jgi:hypothetical protein
MPRGSTRQPRPRLPAHCLRLLPDERGWITFAEARTLFSSQGAQYAFGETDQDGRKNIQSFAAQHRSVVNFMPFEERVYFVSGSNNVRGLGD